MTAASATETGAAPSAVLAAGAFIMQPADIHGEALHEEPDAPTHRVAIVLREFVQKILMAEEWIRGPRGLEGLGHVGCPLLAFLYLLAQVALVADFLDLVELGFQPVDVFLFVLDETFEQFA